MYFRTSKQHGFALAEIIVALFFVSMAIMLVGGLGQQVMQLARSSKQTAAVVEIRSKSNAITRNVDSWLGKMRSSANTSGIFASCIPDPSAASSIYKCPDVDANLLSNDSELQRIAGTQLHAASVPVVDLMGDLIAGTENSPLLLDLDGRVCTSNCPLKSIGYMLRSNPDTDSNPGSVRFVVKIIPQTQPGSGSTPLKTQYFTMDIGMEWAQPAGFCPSGAIKIGYLSSGKPNCINPTKKCATGTIHLGLDASGNPICKTPPASCAGGSVVINAAGDDLACATNTPCENNQIFLGYYSGTGVPMCSTTNLSCPDGQVQVGIAQNGSNLQATCKTLPSCNDSQKLSYDGSKFVCQSASVASKCLAGEIVVGINEDGSAKCAPQERNLASTQLTCPTGKFVSGLKPDGEVICSDLPSGNSGGSSGANLSCRTIDSAAGQAPTIYCGANEKRTGGGCQNVNGGAYFFLTYPVVDPSGREGWQCGSGSTGTLSKAYAICCSGDSTQGSGGAAAQSSTWPNSLTCSNSGGTIYPTIHSSGIDITNGSINATHINYMYPAREGGSMVFTYNVNTGSFIRIIGQGGQGNGPSAAAEACKINMLNAGACRRFTNYPQTSVTFSNGSSQSYRTHSRDPSLTQFCKGRGFATYSSFIEENYIGTLALHNGRGWETNPNGMSIKEITCCN